MSTIQVRPFHRRDRDELTKLVNLHAQAVVPGVSVSVNAVLTQLERESDEFIIEPWVEERSTLVAEQDGRLAAAAYLRRYGNGDQVGEGYRGLGEIRYLLCWSPDNPSGYPVEAADRLAVACLDTFRAWGASRWAADGSVPAPGVYGLPEQWPHIRAIYERAGFVHEGTTEVILLALVDDLRPAPEPPVAGLSCRRTVGVNGTRFSAVLGGAPIGLVEVEDMGDAGRLPRPGGLAEVGNLRVGEAYRRRGVARWLLGQAAEWLRLGNTDRLLANAWPEQTDRLEFYGRVGFRELTRTARGWYRRPDRPAGP